MWKFIRQAADHRNASMVALASLASVLDGNLLERWKVEIERGERLLKADDLGGYSTQRLVND